MDFIGEIVIDVDFNRTLDSLSKDLIYNLIINKIKNTISNSFYSKVQILNQEIENIRINIETILNNISTKELPENMIIINGLIINFTEIVNNQNNKYLMKISKKPFNLLEQFIHNDLEPPLLLIKNEYRSIEENLLNDILEIIKTFPNYYLLIKNELDLESIITNITLLYKQINETLINYVNDLDKDLQSYINKLSYYTFIEGLYSYDKPCEEAFCKVNLENKNINNNLKNQKRRLNKKGKMKNINITRNIRNLDEYNSKMGPIKEEDIDNYILEIKDTLLNFYNSYRNKEYENMKRSLNLFIMKISNIYLLKLETNIDLVASKFSTILTKEIYRKLKNKIFEQYNDIESYILKYSKLIKIYTNSFIELLNDSSKLIKLCYYMTLNRGKGYFKIFSELIQTRLKYITNEEKKVYKLRILSGKNDLNKNILKTLDIISLFNNNIENEISNHIIDIINENNNKLFKININSNDDYEDNDEDDEDEDDDDNILNISIDTDSDNEEGSISAKFKNCSGTNLLKNLNFSKSIQILSGLSLDFSFEPRLNLQVCIDLGISRDLNQIEDANYYIDIFGEAEVGVTVEIGLCIPSSESPINLSIRFGLEGILGKGGIGMKLELFLGEKNNLFGLDLYFELQAFIINFYLLFRFQIKVFFLNFSFEFYIFKTENKGLQYSYHKNRYYLMKNLVELKELCTIKKKSIIYNEEEETSMKCY